MVVEKKYKEFLHYQLIPNWYNKLVNFYNNNNNFKSQTYHKF